MGFDAEYSYVPSTIKDKKDFYGHVLANLKSLLDEQSGVKQNWVSALSSVSSVLYNSYADFELFGKERRVNWAGFYVIPELFPGSHTRGAITAEHEPKDLQIGPYHGRPGCLRIPLTQKRKGVCATAFLSRGTIIVPDVHAVPGHIACDGTTESEVVLALQVEVADGRRVAVGVLDIDCQKAGVWDDQDKKGLEDIAAWLTAKDGIVEWSLL